MGSDDRERSFKVADRRRFTDTGETREDTASSEEAAPATAAPADAGRGSAPEQQQETPTDITFASFVIGLSTQVLVDLGEVPHPSDGSTRVDLPAARQVIDILAILRDKTKGNLDQAEATLLENALYDLRMRYVERTRQP